MALHPVRKGLAVAAALGCAAAVTASPAPPPTVGSASPSPAGATVPAAPAASTAPAPAPAPPSRPAAAELMLPEAEARLRVAEDDLVRVEELRVRGESRNILVQPKTPGARPYQIVPPTGAQDPSQRGRPPAGTSLWRMFSF